MSYLLTVLMLLILATCVGTLYTEGMWSNAIRFINVATAAILAMNFFEPAALWLEDYASSFTFVWDFAALWGLFILFLVLSVELTNRISRVKVRFLKIVDQIGGSAFAFLIGWTMICFVMASLHVAPMSRAFLFGGFKAETKMFGGLSPDRQWLGFVKKLSRGAFSQSPVAEFDPNNDFMKKYASRRSRLQEQIDSVDSILGTPGS
jgi:hypothetical protein